jgi:hypothetical protein
MICAYKECGNKFESKTHNQKYCSDECCRTATNQKLKDQYYEKKARLRGKKRMCKTSGCNTSLSRYNEDKICSKCSASNEKNKQKELIEMVMNVSRKIDKA